MNGAERGVGIELRAALAQVGESGAARLRRALGEEGSGQRLQDAALESRDAAVVDQRPADSSATSRRRASDARSRCAAGLRASSGRRRGSTNSSFQNSRLAGPYGE